MYSLFRSLLFLIEPEKTHYLVMRILKFFAAIPGATALLRLMYKTKNKPVQVAGITFPNRVGLAAGFDKNARWIDELALLGFGHIEIGTVTPLPQPGNEKPRIFRLPLDSGLINRLGFNNQGVDVVAERLKYVKSGVIIGGNIGKNKITPNEDAISDYEKCFKRLYDAVHYFTVNVSSPNTPNLRELQDKQPLTDLLNRLVAIREIYVQNGKAKKPIFLKIAPDLGNSQLDEIVEIILSTGIDGIVATNTTISREGLKTDAKTVESIGAGGLSGKPLTHRSTEIIRYLNAKLQGRLPIIAVGGIMNAQDAKEKLDAGAALVQVYTGFIYTGPGIAKQINKIV